MEIRMRYGPGDLAIEVPGTNVAGVYRPRAAEVPGRGTTLRAVAETDAADRLREESRGRSALLLVSDATRDEPHVEVLETALSCVAPAARVTVVVATGSHRADTPGNRAIASDALDAARRAGSARPLVEVHDCRAAELRDHGSTSRGTRVLLSKLLDGADIVLVASDVKHHWFAGYSNPLKYFLPGIAAFESIERNHRLALEPDATFGRHPWHPEPARRSNPVAEDMLEALELAVDRPVHALVTVRVEDRLVHAEVGPAREATARAMEVADRVGTLDVPRVSRAVVSAGGSPEDDTLYLAHRAVELTRAAFSDGAEVLLVAECRDGVADGASAYENFYLELTRPLDEVLRRIREGYRLYQHKAYKLAELLGRIRALHVASSLPEETVRSAHLRPAPSAQAIVDGWIREDPSCRIAFFDEANRLCVLPSRP
jgi:nickel-dependent lactate racemase